MVVEEEEEEEEEEEGDDDNLEGSSSNSSAYGAALEQTHTCPFLHLGAAPTMHDCIYPTTLICDVRALRTRSGTLAHVLVRDAPPRLRLDARAWPGPLALPPTLRQAARQPARQMAVQAPQECWREKRGQSRPAIGAR